MIALQTFSGSDGLVRSSPPSRLVGDKKEVEAVESGVLGIVDATAFCYVANEEARAVAGIIKKEQYSQVTYTRF